MARVTAAVGQRRVRALRDPPQRAEYGVVLGGAESQSLRATNGILRDQRGLPRYEQADRLRPYRARGYGVDLGVYHEMWRSDAAIFGIFALIARQLLLAYRELAPPDSATGEERQLCDLCSAYLGSDDSPGWLHGGLRGLLETGVLSKIYGFSLHEWVPRADDTVRWNGAQWVVPRRVRYRAPWSVQGWIWEGEELRGVRFRHGNGQRDVPVEVLLNFENHSVPGNPEGTSDLRSAWVPWQIKKDSIVRHEVAEESLFSGVTQIRQAGSEDGPAPWATAQDAETLEAGVDLLTSGTLNRLTVPYGWEVSQVHPEFDVRPIIDKLKWCDEQIFLCMAAVLLGLSGSHAASKSLADSVGSLFYQAMRGTSAALEQTIVGVEGVAQTGLFRRIADLNFPAGTRLPKFRTVGFFASLRELADSLSKLEQFGWLTPTPACERVLRRVSQLPDYSEESLAEIRAIYESGQRSQATRVRTPAGQEGGA